MCKLWGVGKRTFCNRIQCGWSIEDALTNQPGGWRISNQPDGRRVQLAHNHVWFAEGRDECGDRLIRCVRCGMLQSWPGATSPCSGAIRTDSEERAKKHKQKWKKQQAAQDKQRQSIAAERAEWFAERKPK
jgi:hypothetical protein